MAVWNAEANVFFGVSTRVDKFDILAWMVT